MILMIDVFGGLLLCAVLFRREPWSDSSDVARKTRLIAGALMMGLLLGALVYVRWPQVIWFINEQDTKAWTAFVGIPIIVLAIVFFLNSLNGKFATTAAVAGETRLAAAVLVIGLVVDALIYLIAGRPRFTKDESFIAWAAFIAAPIIAVALVVLINALKKNLDAAARKRAGESGSIA